MKNFDRRWIYVIIFIGVALPLIFVIGLPIEVSENVRLAYHLVDNQTPGSTVLLSFDYDPSTKPELHPMAMAVMRHCFEKKYKVVVCALWPMGVSLAEDIYNSLQAEYPHASYGEGYVNLGYKAGGMVTIQSMGRDLKKVFPSDMQGISVDSLAILDNIRKLSDFTFAVSFSAGAPGIKEWIMAGHDKFGLAITGGVTAVTAPSIMAYINEQKQLNGLLGGLKAAAEYEKLIAVPGEATIKMDAQSVAHLIIIIFILIGNISYFVAKKNAGRED